MTLTREQRAHLEAAGFAAKWRKSFTSALKASASYRTPTADSFGEHLFAALELAAQLAELDAHTEAEAMRRQLRARFGPLAVLTPDWWTVRRFEQRFYPGHVPPHPMPKSREAS